MCARLTPAVQSREIAKVIVYSIIHIVLTVVIERLKQTNVFKYSKKSDIKNRFCFARSEIKVWRDNFRLISDLVTCSLCIVVDDQDECFNNAFTFGMVLYTKSLLSRNSNMLDTLEQHFPPTSSFNYIHHQNKLYFRNEYWFILWILLSHLTYKILLFKDFHAHASLLWPDN